jgi:hypothetical protein
MCSRFASQPQADPQALILTHHTIPIGDVDDVREMVFRTGLTNVTVVLRGFRYFPSKRVTFATVPLDGIRQPKSQGKVKIIRGLYSQTNRTKSVQQDKSSVRGKPRH